LDNRPIYPNKVNWELNNQISYLKSSKLDTKKVQQPKIPADHMKHILFVFIGGGLGSAARYGLSKWLTNPEVTIPYGTLVANVLGSLFIGVILGYSLKSDILSQQTTLLLATGFCGGFTTFSTFAYENQTFLKNGDFLNFGVYTLGSFALALIAVFAGLWMARNI
jgi:CrcB protein